MVATLEQTDLRLANVQIENVLKIAAREISPDGKHVIISGPNGSGKTSILDAVWWALGGKSAKEMPEPVHHGADKARTRLELQDETGRVALIVERKTTGKSTSLVVTAGDGQKFNRPQELLDKLMDSYSLDPGAFLRKRSQDQVDDVLRILGVAPPVHQVEEITGHHHEPKAGETAEQYLMRLSADETGFYYHERRKSFQVAQQKAKALDEAAAVVRTLEETQGEAESVTDLVKERQALQQKADERRAVSDKVSAADRDVATISLRLQSIKSDLAAKEAKRAVLLKRIVELQEEAVQLNKDCDDLVERTRKGLTVLNEAQAEAEAAKEAAERLPDPAPELAKIDARISAAEANTKAAAKREHAKAEVERLQQEAGQAKGEHAKHDFVLDRLRSLRQNLLNGASLGIDGLELGEGELRLGGVSFKQASHAEKLRVACAIAFRRDPKLKILRLDDAEHLDAESRRLLLKMADANGWQCLLTFVRDVGELKVEMVEAKA